MFPLRLTILKLTAVSLVTLATSKQVMVTSAHGLLQIFQFGNESRCASSTTYFFFLLIKQENHVKHNVHVHRVLSHSLNTSEREGLLVLQREVRQCIIVEVKNNHPPPVSI